MSDKTDGRRRLSSDIPWTHLHMYISGRHNPTWQAGGSQVNYLCYHKPVKYSRAPWPYSSCGTWHAICMCRPSHAVSPLSSRARCLLVFSTRSEQQSQKCFVDENDRTKIVCPSDGAAFLPRSFERCFYSNCHLQFLSNISPSGKERQRNAIKGRKKRLMPLEKKCTMVEKWDSVEGKKKKRKEKKKLSCVPASALRSGSVFFETLPFSGKWVGFLIPSLQGSTSAWIANVPARPPPLSFHAREFPLHRQSNNNEKPTPCGWSGTQVLWN